jgi:hypothetical protein
MPWPLLWIAFGKDGPAPGERAALAVLNGLETRADRTT